MKDRRWRVALERAEITRLASMLDAIRPELAAYQQLLTDRWKAAQFDKRAHAEADVEEPLRLFICFESLLPTLDELVHHGLQEDKNDLLRLSITEDESNRLRVIEYCARRLPDLPSSIAWPELTQALGPILAALDRAAFEHIAALVTPKGVTCTVDDLKRGRDVVEEPADSVASEKNEPDKAD